MEPVAQAECTQMHQPALDMETEQVQQLRVGAAGRHAEAAHAVDRFAEVQRAHLAQTWDFLEQFVQVVGRAGVLQRTDAHLQLALTWLQLARLRRGGRGRRVLLAGQAGKLPDIGHQGVDGGSCRCLTLAKRQLRPQRVTATQQDVDHRRRRCEFMAPQPVEQRFHLVRQLGHFGEPEGGGAALDRVGDAEDRVQRLVIHCGRVEREQ